MTTLKAVIGANYGDEGKGRVVDYLSTTSFNSIVVLPNGGAQRGHTVYNEDKRYHIFHHFGSGTLNGSSTYLPKRYIVNPMIFMKEFREFYMTLEPTVYMNKDCLVSTPFDMMANQIIEGKRKESHGSCGVGIWETILRSGATLGEMVAMSDDDLRKYLFGVRDTYFNIRLSKKKIESLPKPWNYIFYSNQLIENYIFDFREMIKNSKIADDDILKEYQDVIFENGQGLLLDQSIYDSKHSTPSNTGSDNIKEIVDRVFKDDYHIDVYYVTRSYLTRHGNGELEGEVNEFPYLTNKFETNHANIHQGFLRYGLLDVERLEKRIKRDFSKWDDDKASLNLAITHLDEKALDYQKILNNMDGLKSIIISDGVFLNNIKEIKKGEEFKNG